MPAAAGRTRQIRICRHPSKETYPGSAESRRSTRFAGLRHLAILPRRISCTSSSARPWYERHIQRECHRRTIRKASLCCPRSPPPTRVANAWCLTSTRRWSTPAWCARRAPEAFLALSPVLLQDGGKGTPFGAEVDQEQVSLTVKGQTRSWDYTVHVAKVGCHEPGSARLTLLCAAAPRPRGVPRVCCTTF